MINLSNKIAIPKNVLKILNILELNNFEAFIVGGCVRDSLLGRIPKDWDITTSALPEEIIDIFSKLYRVIPTGLKHGTVTVVIDSEEFEITTYRIDGFSSDNRHPDYIEFTKDILSDLSRRDLSINSLAFNPKIGLIDEFNGLSDLENKRIRTVGNPRDRFSEDALRMLRAVRFSAQLGFDIDTPLYESMILMKDNLRFISKERLRDEFIKIVKSDFTKLKILSDTGLMDYIIPNDLFKNMVNFNQNNPYHIYTLENHTFLSMSSIENELYLKLTMLFHDIGKPLKETIDKDGISHFYGHGEESSIIAKQVLTDLRFDNHLIDKVTTLIKYHDFDFSGSKSLKKMMNKIGEDLTRDLLKVKWADISAQNPSLAKARLTKVIALEKMINMILYEKQAFSLKDLDINGRDLITIGFKPGKEIGKILDMLLNDVIDGKVANNKNLLLEEVKKGLNN